jgi:hypothetical protein
MFIEAQRDALIQATEVAYDVKPVTSTHEAIAAARDRLRQRGRLPHKEWLTAKETAEKLLQSAYRHFQEVAQVLQGEIGSIGGQFSFAAHCGVPADQSALTTAVRNAGHVADFVDYSNSAQLWLNTGRASIFVLTFHSLGPRFHGLIGVVAYLLSDGSEPVVMKDGTFQVNYEEDLYVAQIRFATWLSA